MSVPVPAQTAGGRSVRRRAVAVLAVGAVACGVCCALPFAVPAALLATSGGALALFAGFRGWPVIIAVAVVVAAWMWVALQSYRSRRRPAQTTVVALGIVTAVIVLGLAWPLMVSPPF